MCVYIPTLLIDNFPYLEINVIGIDLGILTLFVGRHFINIT